MAAVRIIWKCNIPRNQHVKALCETVITQAARRYGMDTAVIRKEPHSTTRVNGEYVQTVPHITGDIVNTKVNKGYALHLNLDASRTTLLPDSPPDAPNPEMWELTYKASKGFVLVEADGTETTKDIDP